MSNKKTRQKRVSNRELNSITGNLFPLDSKKHGVDTLGGEATEARKNQLEGNRLLPIAKIKNAVESTLTCSKCLQSKDENNLELFFSEINNLILPDDDEKKQKLKNIFRNHKERLKCIKTNLSLHENTVDLATDIECFCSHSDLLFEIKSPRTCFLGVANQCNPNKLY